MQTPSHPPRTPQRRLSMVKSSERRRLRLRSIAAGVLTVMLLVQQAGGFAGLLGNRIMGADYLDAARYVAGRHQPGEPVIVALPPPAYLAFGETDDLVFLPGVLESTRAQRYTRQTGDGAYVDFWLGIPAIVTVSELCKALQSSQRPWLIVDDACVVWAYGGPMEVVINGMTTETYRDDGGVSVRRPVPLELASSTAREICAQPISSVPAP